MKSIFLNCFATNFGGGNCGPKEPSPVELKAAAFTGAKKKPPIGPKKFWTIYDRCTSLNSHVRTKGPVGTVRS